MTPAEVAEFLKVHVETVREWLRAGDFPNAIKVGNGRLWRIPRADVFRLGTLTLEDLGPQGKEEDAGS